MGQSNSLQNQIVWVTGAGRGMGAAASALLARAGAKVALSSRTAAELESTRALIEKESPDARVLSVVCDVSDEASVAKAYQTIMQGLGRPTALIANAGAILNKPFTDLSLADWQRVMDINLTGSFLTAREFLRGYKAAGLKDGSITFVTSLGGLHRTLKFSGLSAYTAAKCGVTGLMEAVAVEARPMGVRVNAVAPGAVETQMLKEAGAFLTSKTTPRDVGEVMAYLVDPVRARAVHGSVIEIHSNEAVPS